MANKKVTKNLDKEITDELDELIKEEVELTHTNKKKQISSKNIFQSFILICAIVLIIYGLYSNFKEEPKKEEQLPITFNEVKKLYNYISFNSYDLPFYSEDRVDISNIDKNILFISLVPTTKCLNNDLYPCNVYKVSKDDALNTLKQRYGNSVTLDSNSYNYKNISCVLNESYDCSLIEENLDITTKVLHEIQDYKEINDNLIIYDIFLKYDINTKNCYLDNNMTIPCENQEEFINDIDNLTTDKLLEKYGQNYSHTYLKKYDNYYWYASVKK